VVPQVAPAAHTSAAVDTKIDTGVIDAKAREVGEIVETATIKRNVVPKVGPKVNLPIDGETTVATNAGTAVLNVGEVGKAKQVVGEVIETDTLTRNVEKANEQIAVAAADPKVVPVKTGVVGRTAQQVGEIHETEMLDRDLKGVAGAPVAVVDGAGAKTQEHIATGRIDEATRPVAEVVETKTKEREVQAASGAATNITPAATASEKVETGVVNARAKEVADVVETHTTTRDMH